MKILAIRFSGLGDIVMLLPTLKALKERYDAAITLLCDEANIKIKEISCGIIDEVIGIDREAFRQKNVVRSLQSILQIFKLWKKFDRVYDFQSFGESAIISCITGGERFGAVKREWMRKCYTHSVPYNTKCHRSEFFAKIAGIQKIRKPKLCVTQKSRYATFLDPHKKTIGFNIGATKENRRWSEKKFFELAQQLLPRYNVLVFFGPKEKRFLHLFNDKRIIKVYDIDLVELAAALQLCDLVVSNDTGPVHMAAALGVPTLTLFSTGDDWQVGCLNEKKDFIKKLPIDSISVDEVMQKIEGLLLHA
ncbi:glycosyltransferase family 9 protein [Nitratiruptor tergarcus]|uniref:Heptosyltransferase-1 n=1 Tax=Nitratiruptor tergarcus DSM 16512 TaxID=1069081 RepID=A0A1W1WV02_9BACT|nr:glycosyltransferase family 9 protein [Nitratiruptor tergarcus]SMC10148.1 heptosyltransferase-1 [Nitratiruptor tergarcus DSM 16512]